MLIEIYFLLIILGIIFGLLGYFTKTEVLSILSFIIFAIIAISSFNIEKTYCLPLQNTTTNLTTNVECNTMKLNYSNIIWLWAGMGTIFLLIGLWDMVKTLLLVIKT